MSSCCRVPHSPKATGHNLGGVASRPVHSEPDSLLDRRVHGSTSSLGGWQLQSHHTCTTRRHHCTSHSQTHTGVPWICSFNDTTHAFSTQRLQFKSYSPLVAVYLLLTPASGTAPYSYGLILASRGQVTTFLRGCVLCQLPIWNLAFFWRSCRIPLKSGYYALNFKTS